VVDEWGGNRPGESTRTNHEEDKNLQWIVLCGNNIIALINSVAYLNDDASTIIYLILLLLPTLTLISKLINGIHENVLTVMSLVKRRPRLRHF